MTTNGNGIRLRSIDELSRLAYGSNGRRRDSKRPLITPNIERCHTPQDVLEYARKRDLVIVDFKFTDLLGRWHHFSIPIHQLDEGMFDGVRFDYRTQTGYFEIESDMAVWESGRGHDPRRGANLGYRPEAKQGYFRVPPVDAM